MEARSKTGSSKRAGSTGRARGARSRTRRWAFPIATASAPGDVIFTAATFQGRPGEPAAIEAEMERITRAREASQPIREKTGGSTFKNPPGMKAWELIDKRGMPGPAARRRRGLDHALQFSHQYGLCDRRRSRGAGRGGAAPGARDERASGSNGRSSASAPLLSPASRPDRLDWLSAWGRRFGSPQVCRRRPFDLRSSGENADARTSAASEMALSAQPSRVFALG